MSATVMRIGSMCLLSVALFHLPVGAQDEEQYTSLFDGKTLNGWDDENNSYAVEHGAIVCRQGGTGNLLSKKEYSNFQLKFQFRLTPGANNGLGIRAPKGGDAAYQGMELQILDNDAPQYATLEKYQYHGSLYGVAPAERGHLKPTGEWNQQEVTVDGRRVTVRLNGAVILDVDIDQVAPGGKTVDHKDHPGLARSSGHVAFLGHGDVVAFREIYIRPL